MCRCGGRIRSEKTMDIHLLERLKDIVRSAGTTVRSAQDAAMGIREKSSHVDLVTLYDPMVQEFLRSRLLTLLLTLVLVIPAYGQETLDALAAAQGCTAETLLQSDKLTAGDSVSDWVAIAVSRAGTEGDTAAYRKALERYVTRMYREQGGLDRLRATEWQRTALTALALGADPTAFGRDKNGRSVNLLADGVYQFTAAKSLGTQGLNGWIFG